MFMYPIYERTDYDSIVLSMVVWMKNGARLVELVDEREIENQAKPNAAVI